MSLLRDHAIFALGPGVVVFVGRAGLCVYERSLRRILYRHLGVGCARETFSDAEVMHLVDITVSAIEENAPDTFRRIAAGEAPYQDPVHPGLYVYVFDTNVTVVSQAWNPAQIGVNFYGKTDVTGKAFRDELVSGAPQQGSGWVDYVFLNPAEMDCTTRPPATAWSRAATGSPTLSAAGSSRVATPERGGAGSFPRLRQPAMVPGGCLPERSGEYP